MPLVAVAKDKFAAAFGAPKFRPVKHAHTYEQLELVDALTRTYSSDAHLVSYLLPADHPLVANNFQPRLSKYDTPADIIAEATFTTVFIDVDNPGHARWTDEARARAIASYERLPLPCGIYHTTKGARFVLPLRTPVPAVEAEPLIRRALSVFDAAGFPVDTTAKDWTRHMRLPNVVRDRRMFVSPYLDLSRMQPVELEPLELPTRQPASRARPKLPAIPFTPTLAEHWQQRARAIGQSVAASVSSEFHRLYLAVGGALLQRQVPPEHVPELVRLIASAAGSSKPAHHERSAQDTVARYLADLPVTGMRDLALSAPTVAETMYDALDDARTIQLSRPAPEPPPNHALAETTAALERTIATAPDGLTVIAAECGLGKTHCAQRVAVQRATSKNPRAKRAPAQTKTSISVDKNELAEQIASDLSAQGVAVRRIFGPLSVVDADGSPACKLADRAAPLVAGGQSIRDILCTGRNRYQCPHYDSCSAKDGYVDYAPSGGDCGPATAISRAADSGAISFSTPPTPRVTVGPHDLIHQLDASAGSTGLLVVDEPPVLLESLSVTEEDIGLALKNVASFQDDFADAMRPVLLAARAWFDEPDLTFADVTDTLEQPPTEDAKGRPLRTPPLRLDAIGACRYDVTLAWTLGKVSGALLALHRAMTNADALVRLDTEADPPRIIVTAPRSHLAAALRREGAVVAMDANADLHMPGFAKVVGYDPPMHRFAAGDGAPIERTMLVRRTANRKNWFPGGRLTLDSGLRAALRELAKWVDACAASLGRPVTLGIITFAPVRLAIQAAFEGPEAVQAKWAETQQSARTLVEASAEIAAIFASPSLARPVQYAHYYATRGLNRLAGVDCLATLGDPRQNLGEIMTTAPYLGVDDWNTRSDQLAMAELEQAHGRLRTVHRRVPGFALHVGCLVPSGTGWAQDVRVVRGELPSPSLPVEELRALVDQIGGVRAAARAAGCAPSTMHRYMSGERHAPADVAEALVSASPSWNH